MRSAEGFGGNKFQRVNKSRSAGNVFSSFSQCRNFDRKDVEPVKHVTTKHACGDSRLQVTIGGGNHSNISSNGSSSTDTFEFMFLQNTEERDLGLNSALKCGLSKRMPFEAGEASRNRGQLGADAWCHGHTGRPHRAVHGWTGWT